MKNKILLFSMVSILFIFTAFIEVKAQILEYIPSCDLDKSGMIDEFDLINLEEYVDADTKCSTSSEVCICDTDDDEDCDSRDERLCKDRDVFGSSLNPASGMGNNSYPSGLIPETYEINFNVSSYYDLENYDLNNDGVINLSESSFIEEYYRSYRKVYSKRRKIASTSAVFAILDVNNDYVVDSHDKRLIRNYRKYLRKAYGQKVVTKEALSDYIISGILDLNSDGSVNRLDNNLIKSFYKIIRYHIRGKEVIADSNIVYYDFNSDNVVDDKDYDYLKDFRKKLSRYRRIFNYYSSSVKADIQEDKYDLNRDGVINYTDMEIYKSYYKLLRKMKKYTPADDEWDASYDLNEDNLVNDDDIVMIKKFYVSLKQHYRYGKTLLEYADSCDSSNLTALEYRSYHLKSAYSGCDNVALYDAPSGYKWVTSNEKGCECSEGSDTYYTAHDLIPDGTCLYDCNDNGSGWYATDGLLENWSHESCSEICDQDCLVVDESKKGLLYYDSTNNMIYDDEDEYCNYVF
jgi:hypothetical protein